jgi:hypothetical protein
MIDSGRILRTMVADADTVVVVDGTAYDPRHRKANVVLARESDRDSIESLILALDAFDGGQMDSITPGGPSLVFLGGRRPLLTVTCLLPDWVRCRDVWPGDAKLGRPALLTSWLTDHGVSDQARS